MTMELVIENLTKWYGKKLALDHLNLTLGVGIYGILGANGAGKSTLMNLLTDNVKRTEGNIYYNGKEILSMGAEFRRRVGYMPQQQGMYDDFTARHFLYYIGGVKQLGRRTVREQTAYLLELLGLSGYADKKLGTYSGGMRQRVMLAQALLGNPEILILDEPTAGLDPEERIRIRNYISKISSDRIVIFATHVVSDIENIAEEILLFSQGRLVRKSAPLELIESIRDKVAEGFCSREELGEYQKKYCISNIYQRPDAIMLRVVGDEAPPGFHRTSAGIGLEEVYLYYLKKEGRTERE